MCLTGSDVRLINSTVDSNASDEDEPHGIAINIPSNPVIRNTIIWEPNGQDLESDLNWTTAQINVDYCNIEDGVDGEHSISADPVFLSSPLGPCRLNYKSGDSSNSSPCIDAGMDSTGSPYHLKWDIDGDDRKINISSMAVDMGADEREAFPFLYSITKNSQNEDHIDLMWNSESGETYTVLYSDDTFSSSMNWSVADDVSGQTNTTTWTDTSANATSRDYRYYLVQYEDGGKEISS